MKKIVFLPLIWTIIGCSSANESIYFVNKIEQYKNQTPKEPYLMDRSLQSTESLIFTYKKVKELSNELDTYLYDLKSIDKEKYKYIGASKILLGLSNDENKSAEIKTEFQTKITDDFMKATEIFFSKYQINEVDATACRGYANTASKLIIKYSKSSNPEYNRRVSKAIEEYEKCKKSEASSVKAEKDDENISQKSEQYNLESEDCQFYNKKYQKDPSSKEWKSHLDKECKVETEKNEGVQE